MPGRIEIQLPTDRAQPGALLLRDSAGKAVFGPVSAGGIADQGAANAHGNPQRSTILPFGDTPTGSYSIEKTVPTGDGTGRSAHSYGTNGAVVLVPTGGDALLAAQAGRTGLLIHGGDASPAGGLRATHGCVRLSNANIKGLMDAITFLMIAEAPPNACGVVQLPSVDVPDGGTIDLTSPPIDDEVDPPPQDGAAPPILP